MPLELGVMCCICFYNIDPRDHWTDDQGQKWDLHRGRCALEAGRGVPTKYQDEYDRQIRELKAASGDEREVLIADHYRWIDKLCDVMLADATIEEKFRQWKRYWEDETQLESNLVHITQNRFYRKIVGLGPAVVPLLINDLRTGPDHWFTALVELTGFDHGAPANTVDGAAENWIRWWDEEANRGGYQ